MKRKCLIDDVVDANLGSLGNKVSVSLSVNSASSGSEGSTRSAMFKNTNWYRSLQKAEKSCLNQGTVKKIHYKFEDNREMVEEYNVSTCVLIRRAWKVKAKLGGEGKWDVEIGDAMPEGPSGDGVDIMESKDQPQLTKRNTKTNLEWRIRNLPYPIETYNITANSDEHVIVVGTTNKKYFKKLPVPDLKRLNLPLDQGNVSASHRFNTLIITYKKPDSLMEMDKQWYSELKSVTPVKDVPDECKTM